ncbi:MAG TPA: hypothetical protein VMU84_05050 [Thermoanaerobaculia bacterium]|nr:hypothetical protein [Thermoanaerobaculia bacterium]
MTAASEPATSNLSVEIADLHAYLDGVPAELRARGLFSSYEARLRALQEELLQERLAEFVQRHVRELAVDAQDPSDETKLDR